MMSARNFVGTVVVAAGAAAAISMSVAFFWRLELVCSCEAIGWELFLLAAAGGAGFFLVGIFTLWFWNLLWRNQCVCWLFGFHIRMLGSGTAVRTVIGPIVLGVPIILCPPLCDNSTGLTSRGYAPGRFWQANFNTWRDVFDGETTIFYVGSTSRKIRLEASCFLNRKTCSESSRSDQNRKSVCTPMITHPDGKRIHGIREAEEEWGFQFVPFFKNVFMYNCVRLKWALQRKYGHLSKGGCRRLWFKAGNGLEYQKRYGVCMVYISLSFDVLDAIKSGRLIRGRPSLTFALDKRVKVGLFSEGGSKEQLNDEKSDTAEEGSSDDASTKKTADSGDESEEDSGDEFQEYALGRLEERCLLGFLRQAKGKIVFKFL